MTTFNKLLDMKGRLCLITGASGSIGSVLSETMSELGADLIIVDKDLGKLNKLKKTLEKKWKNNIYSYECDIEYEAERKKKDQERSESRKSQIGSGDRSERIRTYNFPQGRVTDHRINLTLHKLTEFLEGEAFDEMIESLTLQAQEESLKNLN